MNIYVYLYIYIFDKLNKHLAFMKLIRIHSL